jgi:protein-S-isoprenylcysteine O-methyltransferase Ste14
MKTLVTMPTEAPHLLVFTFSVIGKIIPVFFFIILAKSSFIRYQATGELQPLVLLVLNALFVCLLIIRRDAKDISASPGLWILSISGTTSPLLMRAAEIEGFASIGLPVQLFGFFWVIIALLSLNRSFGIVPANRGVRTAGLYRYVRHPLYATELLSVLGFVICYPTLANMLVWLGMLALQIARACAEERFLSTDPEYSAYMQKVYFRLIPGIV